MSGLQICLCQFDIVWENVKANLGKLDGLLAGIPLGTVDLIVLPEMFSTGFSMNSSSLAETMTGPARQWMHALADQKQAAVTGSLIIEEEGKYYNRLFWVEPGTPGVRSYDKKHLFTLAGEQHHYAAGNSKLIVEWRGWKIAPFICYDLRFPVWSRNTEEADLLIYVANFPEKREKAWNSLLPARAIENQCFVAGVNRIGADGNGINHRGDSAIYDYEGRKILDLGQRQQTGIVKLDLQGLQLFRRAYPFLRDRDDFHLE